MAETTRKRRPQEEEVTEYCEREEREDKEEEEDRKRLPHFIILTDLISDKAPIASTVHNTNKESKVVDQGSYYRARQEVGGKMGSSKGINNGWKD